jgi:hypothetical protein
MHELSTGLTDVHSLAWDALVRQATDGIGEWTLQSYSDGRGTEMT